MVNIQYLLYLEKRVDSAEEIIQLYETNQNGRDIFLQLHRPMGYRQFVTWYMNSIWVDGAPQRKFFGTSIVYFTGVFRAVFTQMLSIRIPCHELSCHKLFVSWVYCFSIYLSI